MTRLIFLLSLLAVLGRVHGTFEYIKEGESSSLSCSGNGRVLYWFLKGEGEAIEETRTRTTTNVYMNSDGSLQFEVVVKEEHEGPHICITEDDDNRVRSHNVDMVVRPLPLQNVWQEQYRGMFITGFLSALVVLILLSGFCIISKYKWRPSSKQDDGMEKGLTKEVYINPAMADDEGSIISNTTDLTDLTNYTKM